MVQRLFFIIILFCFFMMGGRKDNPDERLLNLSDFETFTLFEEEHYETKEDNTAALPGYAFKHDVKYIEFYDELFCLETDMTMASDWTNNYSLRTTDLTHDIYIFDLKWGLFCITPEKSFYITNAPQEYSSIRVSPDGSAIIYYDYSSNELHLFDIATETDINTQISAGTTSTISPDGKTVAYLVDESELYIFSDGVAKSTGIILPEHANLQSINSEKNLIYYTIYDKSNELESLFSYTPDGITMICTGKNIGATIIDSYHSSIIYCMDGSYYLSSNGNMPIPIVKASSMDILTPRNATIDDTFANKFLVANIEYENCILYYIDANYNIQQIAEASGGHSFELSSDGNFISYIQNDNLYCMKTSDFSSVSLMAENVSEYTFSPDGSSFAYINSENHLYQGNNDSTTKLCENVEEFFYLHNEFLFYYEILPEQVIKKLYKVDKENNVILISDKADGLHGYQIEGFISYCEIVDQYESEEFCYECRSPHPAEALVCQAYFSKDGINYFKGFKFIRYDEITE